MKINGNSYVYTRLLCYNYGTKKANGNNGINRYSIGK